MLVATMLHVPRFSGIGNPPLSGEREMFLSRCLSSRIGFVSFIIVERGDSSANYGKHGGES